MQTAPYTKPDGTEVLITRAPRKVVTDYRDAYARVQALKAEGRKAQQRREQWGRQYVVTYR